MSLKTGCYFGKWNWLKEQVYELGHGILKVYIDKSGALQGVISGMKKYKLDVTRL